MAVVTHIFGAQKQRIDGDGSGGHRRNEGTSTAGET